MSEEFSERTTLKSVVSCEDDLANDGENADASELMEETRLGAFSAKTVVIRVSAERQSFDKIEDERDASVEIVPLRSDRCDDQIWRW